MVSSAMVRLSDEYIYANYTIKGNAKLFRLHDAFIYCTFVFYELNEYTPVVHDAGKKIQKTGSAICRSSFKSWNYV